MTITHFTQIYTSLINYSFFHQWFSDCPVFGALPDVPGDPRLCVCVRCFEGHVGRLEQGVSRGMGSVLQPGSSQYDASLPRVVVF